MLTTRVRRALLATALTLPVALAAQRADSVRAAECPSCAEWNVPQPPMRLQGNTYFVGTHGLSALLITSPAGHILIDGALPESAPEILANIATLGFRVRDVKLILNSHDHFDHAGGLSALQVATHATVAASPSSASVLERGISGADDPQYGVILPFPRVRTRVRRIADGETVRVGSLALTAHFTPGHTPGGTSWAWSSCDEQQHCLNFVYADSQSPISADGFLYTKSQTYPSGIADFERGQRLLATLPCDVLITPHPGASALWERVAAGEGGTTAGGLVDREACRRFAATGAAALAKRIATERAAK